jgi:hypothetical protein
MIKRLLDRIRTVTFLIITAVDFFPVTYRGRWQSSGGNRDFKQK